MKPAGKTATASPTASADATPTQDAVADDLLWGGSEWYYIQANYTLDASAMRFRSNYWGVAPIPVAPGRPSWTPLPPPEARDSAVHAAMTAHRQQVHPTRAALYGRTLWLLVPAGWWVFILLGLSQAMRHWRTRTSLEALAAVVTVGTSVAVVVLVYVDPRNHLLLLPWLAVYAAVGLVHADRWWTHRRSAIRGSVAVSPIVLVAGLVVVGIPAGQLVRQWWLAETVGSLPDVAATAMRMSGEELRAHTAPDTPIMSWHPGFALYADRPWRVLPYEPMPVVSRYALAHGKPVIVLATFHHSPIDIRGLAAVLALRLDPRLTGQDSIVRVQLGPDANPLRWGTLAPDSTAAHP